MGQHYLSVPSLAAMRGHQTRAANRERMTLAAKITLAVCNKIEVELIRPGPIAEERECYEMAQELKDMAVPIAELVAAILKVKEDED